MFFFFYLCVRIVSRLEPNVLEAHLLEEDPHKPCSLQINLRNWTGLVRCSLTNEVRKSEITIGNDTLDLMKFGKVCGIHRLVPEDSVDTE